MRLSHLLPAAALLVAAAGLTTPAGAADLSKLDRTPPKDEPKYATKDPRYCLLVFGPEARTRVWLVRDGDVMHTHASPDGKAPAKWRQARHQYSTFALGDVWEEGGKVCHRNLLYRDTPRGPRLFLGHDDKLWSSGRDPRGKLELAAKASDAPVVHFAGPLTLDLFYNQRPLRTGQTVDLSVVVGTPGVGAGTFAVMHCDYYPKNAWPTAVIEHPRKGGGTPVVARVRLAED
jgi:hypothetical protein